jgi:uncharacterized protein YjiS (DUF1127 family)
LRRQIVRATNRGVVYLDVETTPFVLRAVDAAAALFGRYRAYRQRLADRRMLMSLADRELADMGLYRGDLDRVLR